MPTFREPLRSQVIETCRAHGYRTATVETCLRKFEQGARAEQCIEEKKGKPRGIETGCNCTGCIESRCLTFLFAVHSKLGPGGSA